MSKINLKTGSVTFWTRPNTINFNSTTQHIFFQYKFINGELTLKKNSENYLVFTHKYKGSTTRVKKSISKLPKTKKHFIAVTWDTNTKLIKIYINGKLENSSKINF